jgi:hypothetical protein
MENFDITESSKTKDFFRFILALLFGIVLAFFSVIFLGLLTT